MYKTDEFFLAS